MRRRWRAIAACLMLGALSSVVTAWVFEFVRLRESPVTVLIVDVPGADQVRAYRETWIGGESREIRAYKFSSGYRETGFLGDSVAKPPLSIRVTLWNKSPILVKGWGFTDRREDGRGLPFICLYKWSGDGERGSGAFALPAWTGLRRGTSMATLPYLPLWPGLIANTIFWGGAWWCVLFLPPIIRRCHRIKQGQCPACGYDRAGLTVDNPCPECGAPPSLPRIRPKA